VQVVVVDTMEEGEELVILTLFRVVVDLLILRIV
jgi:hypothetical protein